MFEEKRSKEMRSGRRWEWVCHWASYLCELLDGQNTAVDRPWEPGWDTLLSNCRQGVESWGTFTPVPGGGWLRPGIRDYKGFRTSILLCGFRKAVRKEMQRVVIRGGAGQWHGRPRAPCLAISPFRMSWSRSLPQIV
jgi:hypothetical protein